MLQAAAAASGEGAEPIHEQCQLQRNRGHAEENATLDPTSGDPVVERPQGWHPAVGGRTSVRHSGPLGCWMQRSSNLGVSSTIF